MKIIGTTKDGFIVSMFDTEMEYLTDTYYAKRKFKVGDEIEIHAMYQKIKKMEESKSELESIARDMRKQADVLDNWAFLTEAIITKGD